MMTQALTINPIIQLLNGFSVAAKNSVSFEIGQRAHGAVAAVVASIFYIERTYPDSVEIDDYIAELETLPNMSAALAQARAELANSLYAEGMTLAGLRMSKGLSQAQLAQRVGTSQPALAMWESGKRTPKLASVRRIAMALGCDLDTVINTLPTEKRAPK